MEHPANRKQIKLATTVVEQFSKDTVVKQLLEFNSPSLILPGNSTLVTGAISKSIWKYHHT